MRTAVCDKCGARGLKWAENALGMRYLVDFTTGAEHYKVCPGVKPPHAEHSHDSSESSGQPDGQQQPNGQPETGQQPDGQAADQSAADAAAIPSNAEPQQPETPPTASAAVAIIDQPEPQQPADQQQPQGHEHKMQRELDRLMRIRPALNIMLVGPAGGGKTTACRIAAERAGLAYSERSMGPATSQWDLLGFVSPTTGQYVPGILRGPYESGGVLALDEVDNSNPSVPTAWNSALANGHFTFPDNVEVPKHPDFVCVACANTYGRGADRLYVGRQQLDAATLDRFIVMEWDYDETAEFDWAGNDDIAREWTAFVQRVRARAAALKMRVVISPRASIYGARMLRARISRKNVENAVLWKGMQADQRRELEAVRNG